MMISNSLTQKFQQKKRSDIFSPIAESDWSDYNWQLNHSAQSISELPPLFQKTLNKLSGTFFCTPYYLDLISDSKNCPITGLLLSQQIVHQTIDQSLFLHDDEFIKDLNEKNKTKNGLFEIYLPLLTVCPQRITDQLIQSLKTNDTVIIHLNIQHPSECTPELLTACSKMADAGFILNNRMTFLKDINDSAAVVKELNLKLLMMRVRPYLIYLHDEKNTTSDFLKVSPSTGIQILDSLRGWTSGLAVPHLILCESDQRQHSILPNYIKENHGESYVFRNYKNLDFKYVNSAE